VKKRNHLIEIRRALVVDDRDAAQIQTIFAGDGANRFVITKDSNSRYPLGGRLRSGDDGARIVSFRKNDVLWP